MVREELRIFQKDPPPTDEQLVGALLSFWSLEGSRARSFEALLREGSVSEKDRPLFIARRFWAGLGLLSFGYARVLPELLTLLENHRDCSGFKPCRYYWGALRKLPLPMNAVEDPARAREWLASHPLTWDAEAGEYRV